MNTSAATVTSKGQITIPAAIRTALNLSAGDRVQFIEVSPGRFEMLVASNDVQALKGRVKAKRKVSVEEMNQAIIRKGCE
ncbi:AbrB/MazE/SpoVT family DNA-binding domain-containing protein [Endozoicomonas sp.]|uniref:AbrB/MazE/SpoVT family DNA-binding domain-containing protein n=1 Tax=Endozoicomonas sp. TaxID=1892382 RepID=UPI0028873AFE|nr:AbrB/MazE/SpoVT family DNA-binding domain-containing protein [Endozoicomonas sp.]